jgi:hypothetical protein
MVATKNFKLKFLALFSNILPKVNDSCIDNGSIAELLIGGWQQNQNSLFVHSSYHICLQVDLVIGDRKREIGIYVSGSKIKTSNLYIPTTIFVCREIW